MSNLLPRRPRLLASVFLLLWVALVGTTAARASGADAAEDAAPVVAAASSEDAGRRILAYERALLQDPRAADLREQRDEARREAGALHAESDITTTVTGFLSLDAWSDLALVALLVLALLFLHRGLAPSWAGRGRTVWEPSRRAFRAVTASAGVVLLVAAGAVWLRLPDATASIVVDGPAPLRISPFAEAQADATLPSGSKVQVERVFGDHAQVEDALGRTGWVHRDALEPVCPAISRR